MLFKEAVYICKALAKRTRKSMQVPNLGFVWPSTCVDFGQVEIRRKVDASFSPFGHPTQVGTSWSQVNCMCGIYDFCDLRELASRLANLFGHPSQVRTQVLVLQTCGDLHWLAIPFGKSLMFVCQHQESNWLLFKSLNINAELNIVSQRKKRYVRGSGLLFILSCQHLSLDAKTKSVSKAQMYHKDSDLWVSHQGRCRYQWFPACCTNHSSSSSYTVNTDCTEGRQKNRPGPSVWWYARTHPLHRSAAGSWEKNKSPGSRSRRTRSNPHRHLQQDRTMTSHNTPQNSLCV